MKLYLDTSAPTTILKLDDKTYEWESGRTLNLSTKSSKKMAKIGGI